MGVEEGGEMSAIAAMNACQNEERVGENSWHQPLRCLMSKECAEHMCTKALLIVPAKKRCAVWCTCIGMNTDTGAEVLGAAAAAASLTLDAR